MFNPWLLLSKFRIGSKVKILDIGSLDSNQLKMVGKIGTVTNVDINNEWIGVHVDGGPLWIAKVLNKLGILYTKQKRFDTCKDKRTLPFDFYLQDLNILIEYHGKQHYESINFGGDYKNMFELVKKHDKMKEDWCINNNLKLIVIPYTNFKNIENIVKKEVSNS